MTDARLAAAVEAAARAEFYEDAWEDGITWESISQADRDSWIHEVWVNRIEAALAAADAWDREQGVMRFDPNTVRWSVHTKDTQPYRSDWLTRLGDDDDPDEPREPRPVPQRPDRWWRA